jgi:uncharacterized membrane protein YfcA
VFRRTNIVRYRQQFSEALASTGDKRVKGNLGAEVGAAAAKLAPVGIVATWGPADWMYALTAVYVVLQALYLLWKWHREWKKRG